MKYADEQQSFSATAAARRKQYPADLDSLLEVHERAVERGAADAEALRMLQAEFSKLQAESVQLRADLQAAREEVRRLRTTLTKIRKSASVRVGKAMLMPVRGMRRAAVVAKNVRGSAATAQIDESPSAAAPPIKSAVATVANGRSALRLRQEELLRQVNAEPNAANVMRAVTHAYYVLGDIVGPADLIREHQSVLESLDAPGRRTVDTVLGQERLWLRDPDISPRQPNPGYLAEEGRVMYCAHSTGRYNSNGYSTRTAELVHGLMSGGMDVTVAARPGYPWDVSVDQPKPALHRFTADILGVDHVFNPGPSWTVQPLDLYWLEATDIYVREAQQARVAAVHSASNHVTALPALAAARRLGIPFSYEVRGLWEITEASEKPSWEESERFQLAQRLETLVAVNADVVFAITEQVREELVRRGVERERIHLLPNGVDTNRFTPMPPAERIRRNLDLPDGVPVIGYAGSLVHYEGISDLLKAAAILKEQDVDFRAVIVGDGADLLRLRAESAELGLGDRVIFPGRIKATEVPDYLSVFDVMPCPRVSLPVTELVSPLKPLEAMAAGKAVVLTDLAPLREFAGAGQERALLAEPSNPASLAKALRVLLEDAELRQAMGRRARLWTIRSRQWRSISAGVSEVLKPAIANAQLALPGQRTLRQMSVGIIADAFTTEGLRPEARLTELLPGSWRQQVEETPIDVLLVESAWEGVNGEWRQKVGYYDEDKFTHLRDLVDFCNQRSIPTIFWNKEDPVHFNRFRRTAEIFDHVFTTDSDCIPSYAVSAGRRSRTVASLPFYAQPKLHNPLPTDYPYEHAVAYAGSFYGDRYPARSAELARILTAAEPYGLTIYDRQHLNPDSPYKFPDSLKRFVRGGLPYLEMVKAYKAHPVHINVNSVDESPTMFSRRVAEISASGAVVLSGKGEGVSRAMAGLVQTVSTGEEAGVLLDRWMNDETARLKDAWLAYRLIHRGHTAAHRLAYMLRCAGLVVEAPAPARYAVRIGKPTPGLLAALTSQTVSPSLIISPVAPEMETSGLAFLNEEEATPAALDRLGIDWIGEMPQSGLDRTTYEDLLTATTYGEWAEIGLYDAASPKPGGGLVTYAAAPEGAPKLVSRRGGDAARSPLLLSRAPIDAGHRVLATPATAQRNRKNILIAGHDLKFAGAVIDALTADGHAVSVDQWQGHNQHDEEHSRELLAKADIVFCEWTLGNAVWYSNNLFPHQRLVTRFHSQELFTTYTLKLNPSRIDKVIFVGRHIQDIAIRDHGIPADKSMIIPNPVNVEALSAEKPDDARFTLGLVGIVPAQKGLGRALDLLARLRTQDERYQLRIKGKRPEEYPWMSARPDEMAYYDEQYQRIENDPVLRNAVHFDGHGDDMPEWYRGIGVVLSLSEFESFHLTLADGAASGAVPASLAWPGADQIYPATWLHPSVEELSAYILNNTVSADVWREQGEASALWAEQRFSATTVIPAIMDTILGSRTSI
ncbi:glycosyltransferase [Arthrobacter sp. 7Tela_A1]|uniref:glycosyltransferase n=1 Tax=Arthrobacter sp. 7Tela_A1 TaxID=3093745 RepID=UPI003BB7E2A5